MGKVTVTLERKGPKGDSGNGIQSTVDNNNGTFTIIYTDGTVFTTSDLTGAQGNTGPQGSQGSTGSQGPQGATGPRGVQGETGPTGADSTVPGPQGETGDQGDQGIQGVQGVAGPQGPQGSQGNTGPQGETGSPGADSTVAGPQGATGPQGSTGPQGDQGAQGIQGVQGAQGDTGPQGQEGPIGDTGVQGPQGETGETGPQGIQGIQGIQGPDQGVPIGGTTGQALVKTSNTDLDTQWSDISVVGSIDDLNDVDTTTAAPTDGQALVWNNTNSEWEPGTIEGGVTSIVAGSGIGLSPTNGLGDVTVSANTSFDYARVIMGSDVLHGGASQQQRNGAKGKIQHKRRHGRYRHYN